MTIDINSYLGNPSEGFTLVTEAAPPRNSDYIDGAIDLFVHGVPILDRELWDYVDQLWAYILNMIEELRKRDEVHTFFPDQPIKLTFKRVGVGHLLVSLHRPTQGRNAVVDEILVHRAVTEKRPPILRPDEISRSQQCRCLRQRPGTTGAEKPVVGPRRPSSSSRTDRAEASSRQAVARHRASHTRTNPSEERRRNGLSRWTANSDQLPSRGPKVPEVYKLDDGTVIQWRESSQSDGETIDIFEPGSKRPKKIHIEQDESGGSGG
ncbi:hypothetical protein [Streptomyces sp. JW3]|uniref:hypothetical protein n=1 Tax=Streptomyces sp. JW3 TaxID=3456955 RepID=UPI003FA430C9